MYLNASEIGEASFFHQARRVDFEILKLMYLTFAYKFPNAFKNLRFSR